MEEGSRSIKQRKTRKRKTGAKETVSDKKKKVRKKKQSNVAEQKEMVELMKTVKNGIDRLRKAQVEGMAEELAVRLAQVIASRPKEITVPKSVEPPSEDNDDPPRCERCGAGCGMSLLETFCLHCDGSD